jgi:hypothetical protein
MLLHLSAGACVFEMAPEKVNEPAFEYCHSGSYSIYGSSFDSTCAFCPRPFAFTSDLLQHAEIAAVEA